MKVFLAGRPTKIPGSTAIEAERLKTFLEGFQKNGVKKWSQKNVKRRVGIK
ncbi:hypothetical protein [Methanosarcina barkeri]|uniref:hypothetical protein n=1 Tax=Methanosarcina barkeri TaxID=2208 RepID=UPI000A70EB82|nr:hypothetical protein [Methanosarcina barkeri]